MTMPRPEYPRPQFVRERWLNLNGTWRFDFDDADAGLRERWSENAPLQREITVPFAFQSKASGIHTNEFHDVVWYQRGFEIPADWHGSSILLHFGAVDYRAWVWVNGSFAAYHEGGHTPFRVDITPFLRDSANTLVVRVEDSSTDLDQPRGKQYWKAESASIFYTRTTGIWQTVWLEPVGAAYLDDLRLTPDVDRSALQVEYVLAGSQSAGVEVETDITYQGEQVAASVFSPDDTRASLSISLGSNLHLWSPENPALYDLTVRVKHDGQILDEVQSYFGMRKISIDNGQIRLNNQPYLMKLVLDQGYHPDGVLTFPTDEDFRRDIELTKTMGFNGARKHQKVEDPRYLYWADKIGLLVWGEMANTFAFSPTSVQRLTAEWQAAVRRDYNHPCIVAWVPMNESWGVPDLKNDPHQRGLLVTLYNLTRSLDSTRLVISNDGWEHAQTDLLTIHDYESNGAVLSQRYSTADTILAATPAKRDLFTTGFAHQGQPILLTEYGGVAFRKNDAAGWGYSTASDEAEFVQRYREIVEAVMASSVLQGFCYTQLTDVEQEINGLLTYDRQPKTDLSTIAAINAVGAYEYPRGEES
ncbi:MAG: glycoside hydrolase family 2 TIM barrel-domain containing protein [Anaerolineae bacterium]